LKISRKTWVITGVGVIAIVLIALGMLRFQQVRERGRLEEQLSVSQSKSSGLQVTQLTLRQAELDRRLTQAQSQLEAVKAIFSEPFGDVITSGVLFEIAKTYNVEITGITPSNTVTEKLGEITFSVTRINAKVEGDVLSIANFVIELNSYFGTGAVRTIKINVPTEIIGEKPIADMQLALYTYQGS
jgi:hypothetical protein